MPWSVQKTSSCPDSRPWGVVNDDNGNVEGCHSTKAAAEKQQAALYANVDEGDAKAMNMQPTQDRESLIRMTTELRAQDDGRTLVGYAAVFDQFTEINSWEGRFRERIQRGAFRKTLRENRNSIKVLFNHGMDPSIGDKPLGKPRTMKEDSRGLYVEVPLDDTSYNQDIIASLRSGALDGMSFRMTVQRDEWDDLESDLPERTIKEIRLYEFGPVTFPAYEATEAGVRAHAQEAFMAYRNAQQAACPTCAARSAAADPSTGSRGQVAGVTVDPSGTLYYSFGGSATSGTSWTSNKVVTDAYRAQAVDEARDAGETTPDEPDSETPESTEPPEPIVDDATAEPEQAEQPESEPAAQPPVEGKSRDFRSRVEELQRVTGLDRESAEWIVRAEDAQGATPQHDSTQDASKQESESGRVAPDSDSVNDRSTISDAPISSGHPDSAPAQDHPSDDAPVDSDHPSSESDQTRADDQKVSLWRYQLAMDDVNSKLDGMRVYDHLSEVSDDVS